VIEAVKLDIAAVITAISLVITAAATFIVAFRDKKPSEEAADKAVSVTQIHETDKKVETLIQQVDFLFDEISKLRTEKDSLERQIVALTNDLNREREDHNRTKSRLDALLVELDKKNKRIAALEYELSKIKENNNGI
jgi:hypothetical protein